MSGLIERSSIASLVRTKTEYFHHLEQTRNESAALDSIMKSLGWYSPLYFQTKFDVWGEDRDEKYIDKALWRYMVKLFNLKNYMLCTEFEKMEKQIENHDFPQFTQQNAEAWISGLKGLIQNNVQTLVKQVYREIVDGYYYTGSGYSSREKKKRNNTQVDRTFILFTNDYLAVFGYSFDRPTVTDDLEKVAHLLSGELIPEISLKQAMRSAKTAEGENRHMKVVFRKNGNTQYTLSDDIRDLLNKYGPDGRSLGQDIKIKIFD